ncbi:MAG TPA: hypothetical protein VL742_10920 [Casimicrobiaceae bacterium]|nr:hypothetical protein [Casimicrobiaceae bacterium]
MPSRTLLCATILGAVLWGCTPALTIQTIGTSSPTASHVECTRSCRVGIVQKCAFGQCKFAAEFDEIHLARGSRNVSIVWHLPDGHAFCNRYVSDGGVVLKGANDEQFSSMYSTDDPDGAPPGPSHRDCRTHAYFHWTGVNSVPRPEAGYGYTIIFYDRSGHQHALDPWIYND